MDFFDMALAAAGAVHDVVVGETFAIAPQAKPTGDANARSIADPARPAQTFTGVWTGPHAIVHPTNRTGHPAAEGQSFADGKPRVDFEIAALPYPVKILDLVTRQKTGAVYAVADPGGDGDGFTRTTIALTAARGRA